ncbi:hypothetical protein DFQ28_008157 [Apophysomyces sp. BC1034]|nr:hypothetical protein DFQ30_007871 [Apophysomyces sp. BC1015]KAG0176170.1 hypothetical protein DFQ29_006450 [Apophysomyces sp. BC1021]KAG0186228.1 hypothetical protein DFQ28_008157 [Apophysomyces sp. BC1034]
MSDQTQVDVIIVGGMGKTKTPSADDSTSDIPIGGPVGLLAANLCIKSGFKVRIVDIEFEPQHWGRGDWVHGRTLEILNHSGLADDLLQTGAKVDSFSMHHQGKRTCEPFVPEAVVTKYKHLLCVGQHITESTFQHTLADEDVQVERPVTVSEFEMDDDPYPIRATLHNVSSDEKTVVRAKYLLGCDGAHSDIRRQLGIQSEGQTTCMNSGVLDALIKTNFPDKKSVSFIQGSFGSACLFPRENNLTRVMVHMPQTDVDRNQIQLEDIQTEARRALLPFRVDIMAVLWWTVYSVGQHVAQRYQIEGEEHPRVFLCGDACHSQSPTLGQGLNTGLGDVFNLIWKIAFVEAGLAKPNLLSTYEAERRPVAQKVIAIDSVVAKAAQEPDEEDEDEDENVKEDEKSALLDMIRTHQHFTTGFGVTYRDSDTSLSRLSTTTTGALRPGDRAPDYKVVQFCDNQKTRLYDLWQESAKRHTMFWCFHLIILAGDLHEHATQVQSFCQELKKKPWCSERKPWLQLQLITTTIQRQALEACELEESLKQTILIDKINNAQCHHGYGVKQQPTAVLVRPDLHIGWIGTLDNLDSLDTWLSAAF